MKEDKRGPLESVPKQRFQVHLSFVTHRVDMQMGEDFLVNLLQNVAVPTAVVMKKHVLDEVNKRQCGYGFVYFTTYDDAVKAVAALKHLSLNGVKYDCSLSKQTLRRLGKASPAAGDSSDDLCSNTLSPIMDLADDSCSTLSSLQSISAARMYSDCSPPPYPVSQQVHPSAGYSHHQSRVSPHYDRRAVGYDCSFDDAAPFGPPCFPHIPSPLQQQQPLLISQCFFPVSMPVAMMPHPQQQMVTVIQQPLPMVMQMVPTYPQHTYPQPIYYCPPRPDSMACYGPLQGQHVSTPSAGQRRNGFMPQGAAYSAHHW